MEQGALTALLEVDSSIYLRTLPRTNLFVGAILALFVQGLLELCAACFPGFALNSCLEFFEV